MVLLVPLNKIFILDLVEHRVRYYNYYFQIEASCQVQLYTFGQTDIVCICENGAFNDNRFKLTYFSNPFPEDKKENFRPLAIFESQ
jgi:hypothetical protein